MSVTGVGRAWLTENSNFLGLEFFDTFEPALRLGVSVGLGIKIRVN
jgi:hypothetical protein